MDLFPESSLPETSPAKVDDDVPSDPTAPCKTAVHKQGHRRVTRVRNWWRRVRNPDEAGPLEDEFPLGQPAV